MYDLIRPAIRYATSSSRCTRSTAAFFLRIATRVSKSGGWMSAIRPHSNRERRRSSISGMSFGEQSLDRMICFRDSYRSLNVWKNSSCVRSLPEMNWMSSIRRRSIVR